MRGGVEHVVRDSVHGIIRWTTRERKVVNALVVQRLRELRQLHLAPLIFPSANHSTLSHAIGAVGAFQRMVQQSRLDIRTHLEGRARDVGRVGLDPEEAVELALILRFVGRPAFKYVLDSEPDRIKLEERKARERLLGEGPHRLAAEHGLTTDSEVRAADDTSPPIARYASPPPDEREAPPLIRSSLTSDQILFVLDIIDGKVPLLSDFITHPAGPDVLDYVERDALSTGFQHLRIDDAIFSCFDIDDHGSPRLVLRTSPLAYDAASRLFDGVSGLSQQVSGHHTVLAARAMLKEAIRASWRPDRHGALHILTDDEVIDAFLARRSILVDTEGAAFESSRLLVRRLIARQLYKRSARVPMTGAAQQGSTALMDRDKWQVVLEEVIRAQPLALPDRDLPLFLRSTRPIPLENRLEAHRISLARREGSQHPSGGRDLNEGPLLEWSRRSKELAGSRVLFVFSPRSDERSIDAALVLADRAQLGPQTKFDFNEEIPDIDGWITFFETLSARSAPLRLLQILCGEPPKAARAGMIEAPVDPPSPTIGEIASTLGVTEATIWSHVKAIDSAQVACGFVVVRRRGKKPIRLMISARGVRAWLGDLIGPMDQANPSTAAELAIRLRNQR